ncbi:hypothetical protein [Haloprofundus marisrubri]|uniref:hypothetical protein n=1 Tax=Haloprofundus marisrubri TaxID=1514971 RepID=UPI0012BAA6BC|nr:hypothetical protein [Haloprofundus marisrubri]
MAVLGLTSMVILAGCSMAPLMGGDQQGPVTVGLINDGNSTYSFEVWVAEGPLDGIQVQKGNGETVTVPAGPGLTKFNYSGKTPRTTSVQLPESARDIKQISISPGEVDEFTIEDPPSDPVVVVTVRNDTRVIALVTAACSGDFNYLEVTTLDGRATAGYNC